MPRKQVAKKDKKIGKKGWTPTRREYKKRTEKPEALEKGDVLEGKIVAIQAGAQSPVLVIKEDDTEKIRRVWMPTILKNSITTEDIGGFAAIHCKGQSKTKAGRKLIDFDVFIAPAETIEESGEETGGDEEPDNVPF